MNTKTTLVFIITIFIILISIIYVRISFKKTETKNTLVKNSEYEQYLGKILYGTDVMTLINKASDSNNKNDVQKDDKGYYIENEENSIKIDLIVIADEEKEETQTFKMETISKVGIAGFISNFNTAKFKITDVKYHEKTKQISYLEITEQYDE